MVSRKLAVFLFLLFTLSLVGGCTTRSDEGLVPDSIEKWFKAVFVDVADAGNADPTDDNFVITMRVLFMLLAFSVLFGISQVVMKGYAKNVRLAVCFLLGLIATVMIPGALLATMAQSYGAIFAAVLIGAPTVGLVYLMFGVFNQPNRTHWAANLGISLLLWYIIGTFSNQVFQIVEKTRWTTGTKTVTTSIAMGGGFIAWIFLILAIWFAFKFIMGEQKDEELPEEAKNAMKAVGRWFRTRKVGAIFEQAPKLLNEIEAAVVAQDPAAVNRALSKESKIIKDFGEAVGRAQSSIVGVPAANRAAIQRNVSEMEAARRKIEKELAKVKVKVNQAAGADWPLAQAAISDAQEQMRIAVSKATEFVADIS